MGRAVTIPKTKEDREAIASMIAMDYISGKIKNKGEIANKYGVDLSFVITSINHEIFKIRADEQRAGNNKVRTELPVAQEESKILDNQDTAYSDGNIGVKIDVPDIHNEEHQQSRYLSEEQKISILIDYDSDLSAAEIAEKYGVHVSTIYNTWKREGMELKDRPKKKKGDDDMKRKKVGHSNSMNNHQIKLMEKEMVNTATTLPVAKEKPKAIIKEVSTKPVIIAKASKISEVEAEALSNRTIRVLNKPETSVVKCGLIADRHDMPVSDFVFSRSLDSDLMFDFDRQYRMVEAFIRLRIKFENGVPNKEIQCYVSGLQSPLVTLIRVCNDLKVRLTIMHYNIGASGMWSAQPANSLPAPTNKRNENLALLYSHSRIIYTFGMTEDQVYDSLVKNNSIFLISIIAYQKRKRNQQPAIQYVDRYICRSYEDVFKLYPELLKKSRNLQEYVAVAAAEIKFENGGFHTDIEITRGYNRPEVFLE